MNGNISNIIKELEGLDSELNVLINLKDSTNDAGILTSVTTDSIEKRIQLISFSILNLQTELANIKDIPAGININDLVSTYLNCIVQKCLLKSVMVCNNNLQVLAPLSNKMQNRTNGLITEFNKLSECIDSLLSKNK